MREGYKNSVLGEIPEDWDVVRLGDVGEFKNGINKGKEDFGIGYPLVNLNDVFGKNAVSDTNLGLVNSDEKERELYSLESGDVLFIRSSVKPSGVGLTALVENDIEDAVYSGFIIRYRDKGFFDSEFKKHCFYDDGFRKRLLAKSTVSANTNINQGALNKLVLACPTKEEQQKIAKILSIVDEKIDVIDQRIIETTELKKGLMQKLLTKGIGHTKFKDSPLGEIPENWECVQLNEISTITRLAGYEYSEYWQEDENGEILALRGYNIGKNKIFYHKLPRITNELSLKLNRSRLYKGDVVFPCVGTIGNAAVIEEDDKFHINQNIAKITPNQCLNSQFLVQYLISNISRNEIDRFNATTSQPNVLVGSLRKFRVPFPTSLSEQKQIANILSTVDNKLDVLKDKKSEHQELKKGLMQQLLTGKVRVKVEERVAQ